MQRRLGFMVVCMMVIALSVYGTAAKEQRPVTLKVLMVYGCVNQFNAINPVFEKENPRRQDRDDLGRVHGPTDEDRHHVAHGSWCLGRGRRGQLGSRRLGS